MFLQGMKVLIEGKNVEIMYLKVVESSLDHAMVYDSLEVEIVESDLELEDSDVVEPDYDPPLQVGGLKPFLIFNGCLIIKLHFSSLF